jgi:GT2 family glycosyltransferase
MRTSIVVPTYRRPEALRETLEALVGLNYPRDQYEVIVVDDGSGDETPGVVEKVAAAAPGVRYVHQENAGVAKARNTGAANASGELLIFLDDDILVAPDHIERHLEAREHYGDCLVNGHWEFSLATLSALEQTPFGRFRIGLEDWVKTENEKQPLDDGRLRPSEITAANLSITATSFDRIGGFDEAFPFAGCEDQDFSYRAQLAGYVFLYDPAIRLLHNDERVTLEQFCARQRRGAQTSVYLVARHPDRYADRPLLLENAPATPFDPWRLRLKKLTKAAYASAVGLATAAFVTRLFEKRAPRSPVLARLYTMTIGASIFLGVRDGLAQLPEARTAAYEVMRERHGSA